MSEDRIPEQPKDIDEVRKLLAAKTLLIGERTVTKNLLQGTLRKVFLAKNCKADIRREVERAKTVSGVAVAVLDMTNEELGVVCKRPYAVSLLGVKA
jgi:ribosomal protein L30E